MTEMTVLDSHSSIRIFPMATRRTSASGLTDVDCITDPRLQQFLRYWLSLRRGRLVPERRDFDPAEVSPILGYFWICRREPRSRRFRFRLAGEEIRGLVGKSIAGEYVDDVFPGTTTQIKQALEEVLMLPALHYLRGPLYRDGARSVLAERLALPMSDGGIVSAVYGATLFSWPRQGRVSAPQIDADLPPTIIIPVCELPPSDLLDACRP
jgi:hypothetical protein